VLLLRLKWSALALVAGVAALLAFQDAGAADKDPAKPAASKLDLTPESMPKLFALIRPQETEWRHLKVQWITDVIAARRQAAKEDKPLVVLYTGGAGYNEPLGIC
jgi:hypothetical protein